MPPQDPILMWLILAGWIKLGSAAVGHCQWRFPVHKSPCGIRGRIFHTFSHKRLEALAVL
jgi:hypothetical protein